MDPKLIRIDQQNLKSYFTLAGVDVSIANAIRRTILSHIDVVVMRTTPYEKNDATIHTNTTRFNNEIVKQRLSCIPIHITDMDFPVDDYIVEIDVKNEEKENRIVTTEDFRIKNVGNEQYLSKASTAKIFPAHSTTKQYVDFVRLRPEISDEIKGEHISMTCKLSKGNASENGMFNVVSTCSYGFTPDVTAGEKQWSIREKELQLQEKTEAQILQEKHNFALLDAKRSFVPDSFDFVIESIGIYTCSELIVNACSVLNRMLSNIIQTIENDNLQITLHEENTYNIILQNMDHTIGKLLEYIMYHDMYLETQKLNFCGFQRQHPHDEFCVIRIGYTNAQSSKDYVKNDLKIACLKGIQIFEKVVPLFET